MFCALFQNYQFCFFLAKVYNTSILKHIVWESKNKYGIRILVGQLALEVIDQNLKKAWPSELFYALEAFGKDLAY